MVTIHASPNMVASTHDLKNADLHFTFRYKWIQRVFTAALILIQVMRLRTSQEDILQLQLLLPFGTLRKFRAPTWGHWLAKFNFDLMACVCSQMVGGRESKCSRVANSLTLHSDQQYQMVSAFTQAGLVFIWLSPSLPLASVSVISSNLISSFSFKYLYLFEIQLLSRVSLNFPFTNRVSSVCKRTVFKRTTGNIYTLNGMGLRGS